MGILPISLPELPIKLRDLRNNQKSSKHNFLCSIKIIKKIHHIPLYSFFWGVPINRRCLLKSYKTAHDHVRTLSVLTLSVRVRIHSAWTLLPCQLPFKGLHRALQREYGQIQKQPKPSKTKQTLAKSKQKQTKTDKKQTGPLKTVKPL